MRRDFENSLLYFQGFTFLIILPLKQKSVSGHVSGCPIATDQAGRLRCNCQSMGMTSIPQNLDAKIQILDISFNKISTLNKDDLKNYPNLWGLVLTNLPLTSFPEGFFQHTPLLKMLNISNTHISDLKTIPTSVANLNFTFCKLETIDLSHLVNLKRLFMRNSEPLKKIPAMFSKAPLEVLDLKFCEMSEASYQQIAPFCKLRYFGLNSTVLMQERYVVKCCGLRKWGLTWNMTGFKGQLCSRTESHPFCHSLGIKFDENSIQQYRDCIYDLRIFKYIIIIIVFIVVVILVVVLVTAGILYHHFKTRTPKHEDRESSTITEEDVEAENEENSTD